MLLNHSHTAEEVPALAIDAGSDKVRAYLPNTRLFHIMMEALGWDADQAPDRLAQATHRLRHPARNADAWPFAPSAIPPAP